MSREPEVTVERVVGGLQEPVALVFLSETQWLVAERRSGRIRWIENGRLREEPFATVQVPSPAGYHEYGLLGLAVDPEYETNGYVYAFHTVGTGNRATGPPAWCRTTHPASCTNSRPPGCGWNRRPWCWTPGSRVSWRRIAAVVAAQDEA